MWSCIWFIISGFCVMWTALLVMKLRNKIPDIIVIAIMIQSILLFLVSAKPLL